MSATPGRRSAHLPAETTSFIDRSGDIEAVTRLLSKARLVTLVGAPGVGKTRLAVRIATLRRRRFPGGVWLVELAPVRQSALVSCSIAQVIGIRDDTGGDPLDRVAGFLRDRRALLVLDNCEHLADECGALAASLLRAARHLRILATSRHTLQATGEHVWEVRPLPVSQPGGPAWLPPERDAAPARPPPGVGHDAVGLFTQRAAAAVRTFSITRENAPHVAAVCHRLDGIPLAIELAAVRLNAMTVTQLLAGLDDRFRLLTRQSHSQVAHHRTLAATMDWSFGLCEPAEQALWARLSVFAGGFDVDAVQQVCADADGTDAETVDLLEGLVTKSVLLREVTGEVMRFQMLETLRQYGAERLREAGQEDYYQRRHAQLYLQLAEQAERGWFGPDQSRWFGRLQREHENLRAALQFLSTPGAAEPGQRMAAALWFHWVFSGRVAEGRIWLDRVLALPDEPTPARARALWANAFLAGIEGNLPIADRLAARAKDLAGALGEEATLASALTRQGVIAVYRGDSGLAEPLLVEALGRYHDLDDAASANAVLARIGLSMALLGRGDLSGAAHTCREAIAVSRRLGDRVLLAFSLNLIARIELLAGDLPRAAAHTREALQLCGPDTPQVSLVTAVEHWAWITGAGGDHRRAAMFLGAAGRLWQMFGLTNLVQAPYFHLAHDDCVDRARRALTDAAFEAAVASGEELTIDQVIESVTGQAPGPPCAADDPVPSPATDGSG